MEGTKIAHIPSVSKHVQPLPVINILHYRTYFFRCDV